MKSIEYLQHIESNLLFFNKLRYETLATGYRLVLAAEQNAENDFNAANEHTLKPELLSDSKDKAVQILGNLFSELTIKIEQLASISNIELKSAEDMLEQYLARISRKDNYNDLFSSYTDTLVSHTIDRVDILDDLIFKSSEINYETIHTSQLDKRLELLRPYADTNTALLLDMTLSLRNAMAAMMQEGLDEKVIISKCVVEPFELEDQSC